MGIRKGPHNSANQSTMKQNARGSAKIVVDTDTQMAAQRARQKAASLLQKNNSVLLHH
jgi:hypothetical protein